MTQLMFKTSDRTVSHAGVVKPCAARQRARSLSRFEKNPSIQRDSVPTTLEDQDLRMSSQASTYLKLYAALSIRLNATWPWN
jgi:hypothetical protein